MPALIAAPPVRVPVFSGFDYMTVDEARHRAYAAHTRSNRLLIVDTLGGAIAGQVDVGPMHGVAVDPQSGDVFTGNGTDDSLSRVDVAAMKVIASVSVPGHIDAIAYDPARQRIYADQAGGGNVYVVDAATMKPIATLTMPASKLESPAVDPKTGTFYQNLANGGGFAIVDPQTLRVSNVIRTPELENNHALVFAAGANQVGLRSERRFIRLYARRRTGRQRGGAAAHRSMQHRVERPSRRLRRSRHRDRGGDARGSSADARWPHRHRPYRHPHGRDRREHQRRVGRLGGC